MNKLRIIPAVTAMVLSAAWLAMTVRGQTPPPALSQAIIGAIGATVATKKDGEKKTGKKDGDAQA